MENRVETFVDYLTSDWTDDDWKENNRVTVVYHVVEWMKEGGDLSDFFLAKFAFEEYMGW